MFDVLIIKHDGDYEYIRKVKFINKDHDMNIFITDKNAFGIPDEKIANWRCIPDDSFTK